MNMEIATIQNLAAEWHAAAQKVIEFENPGFLELRQLLAKTYEVLCEYKDSPLVPKEISALLLEMQDFGWWVGDLEDTPLHPRFREISSAIFDLFTYFLSGGIDPESIRITIDQIAE
jgi:hypothetical protein